MSSNIKKDRYDKGDWVILYREPEHEGPHESDFDYRPPNLWKVQAAVVHPNNEDWVTEYVVAEPTDENASGLGDPDVINPGQIARLATDIDQQEFKDSCALDDDLDEAAALIDWLATALSEKCDPSVFPYRAWFERIGNWESRRSDA